MMAFIPRDAIWYIAEVVLEITVEGATENVVHIDYLLVRRIPQMMLMRRLYVWDGSTKRHTSIATRRKSKYPFGDCAT